MLEPSPEQEQDAQQNQRYDYVDAGAGDCRVVPNRHHAGGKGALREQGNGPVNPKPDSDHREQVVLDRKRGSRHSPQEKCEAELIDRRQFRKGMPSACEAIRQWLAQECPANEVARGKIDRQGEQTQAPARPEPVGASRVEVKDGNREPGQRQQAHREEKPSRMHARQQPENAVEIPAAPDEQSESQGHERRPEGNPKNALPESHDALAAGVSPPQLRQPSRTSKPPQRAKLRNTRRGRLRSNL